MNEITILHLSDIHFKKKKEEDNKNFRKEVQKSLINAVKAHSKEHSCPDFVAVTGDIAFSGKEKEYLEALDFFKKLKAILPGGTQFLAVPGNHDVDRNQVIKFFPLHRIVEEGNSDEFLESKKYVNDFILVKFKAFRDFCREINPAMYESRQDYFWVKNFADRNVSFLGLNSAWASERNDERFQIALGMPQVYTALEKATLPNRVILMHHPPFNWLEERDVQKWSGKVFNQCGLILHGHVHVDAAMSISTPSDSCISIGANAAYTHDGYIGFQFIRVRFLKGYVNTRVWPYKLETLERPVFLSHTSRWISQKGKPYFDLESRGPCGDLDDDLRPLQIPKEYREWVTQFHSRMDIQQLDPNARAYHIPLPEVYIPIETANPFHKPKDEKMMKERGKKEILEGQEESRESKEPPSIDIEELLGRKPCILLRGPAGMGKTTLVKHLAYTITHGQGPIPLCGSLPVMVFLKDLWPIYRAELSKAEADTGITFKSLLKVYLETRTSKLQLEVVESFMSRGQALFLLDGLDEVPEQIRGGLVEIIALFHLENKANRFLLTGRSHGIDVVVIQHFGAYLHDINLLDNRKVKDFVSNWFRVVSGQAEGLAEMTAAEMIGDIEINPNVSVFTENPLLLTAVCILYLDSKRLPDQRAELYLRIVDNLICRRFHHLTDPENASRIEDYLKLLAFHMQERNARSLAIGKAKELLKEVFPKEDETPPQYKRKIDHRFEEIEPRCGLLKRSGGGEVEFLHLTFQEFLAARHILYMDLDYKQFLGKRWWEETILLYTGLVNREWKDKANLMVKEILAGSHKDPKILYRLWLLGARALRDIQSYKRDIETAELAGKKLIKIIRLSASLDERFEAGDILGTLGDPRIKGYSMVKVEAGEFTIGSNNGDNDEKPIHRVYVDEFMIGKYPVTNEGFKAFIDDGGYDNQGLWTTEGWKWKNKENISYPLYWYESKWNRSNFPVVGVSWFEAVAYANWLSKKTGKDYRLPTEAEWEKAARGSDGSEFPWGDAFGKNKCNSAECGLSRTSPVGIFPGGESPYGCMDMAGNVYEWCWDWFGEGYYKESPEKNPRGPLEGSHRVVRGGCWFSFAPSCRAAYRIFDFPASRHNGRGFRLVRSL